jgi:hypothetical protein
MYAGSHADSWDRLVPVSVEYHSCGRARHNERANDDKEFVFHGRDLRRRRKRQYLDIG